MSLDRLMATIRALSLIALCVFDTSLQKTPGGAGSQVKSSQVKSSQVKSRTMRGGCTRGVRPPPFWKKGEEGRFVAGVKGAV